MKALTRINTANVDVSIFLTDEDIEAEPKLKSGARRILNAVIESQGLERNDLADAVEMSASSGTFSTYLSMLRTNGLIKIRGSWIEPDRETLLMP